MSKTEIYTHWIIGVLSAVVWFWGDKLGIPAPAQAFAASVVPALVMHALGRASAGTGTPSQQSPQPQSQPENQA